MNRSRIVSVLRSPELAASTSRSSWWSRAAGLGLIAIAACSGGEPTGGEPTETEPTVREPTVGVDVGPTTVGTNGTVLTPVSSNAVPPQVVSTTPAATTSPATTDLRTSADKDVVTRSADAVGAGVVPAGFSTVTVRIESTEGETCEVCMWLADSGGERSRGLMGVTDLGAAVGMVFAWDVPVDSNFFMFNTPMPLSIAWVAPEGTVFAEADMEPCVGVDSATCKRYGAGGPYDLAIEMVDGQLAQVGIGPGAAIEIVEGSEASTCALGAAEPSR